tara:strand:- start:439 stop:633 length:195 start_codon:yes stop_codon:yes gene_type:complete
MRQWITSLDKHDQTIAKKIYVSANSVTNLEKNKDLKIVRRKTLILKKKENPYILLGTYEPRTLI